MDVRHTIYINDWYRIRSANISNQYTQFINFILNIIMEDKKVCAGTHVLAVPTQGCVKATIQKIYGFRYHMTAYK